MYLNNANDNGTPIGTQGRTSSLEDIPGVEDDGIDT